MEILAKMRFSAKVALRRYTKTDGTREVCIQAIVNRREALVGLGFHVDPRQFRDGKVLRHPNAESFNLEISKALHKANEIASEYRLNDKYLTHREFVEVFSNPVNKRDFLAFARKELERRKPHIDKGTYQQNQFALDKLEEFRPVIRFTDLNVQLIDEYVAFELKKGNQQNTVNKTLTTWKLYINAALKVHQMKFRNPFEQYRIRKVKPKKVALSEDELRKLINYFREENTTGTEKEVARCFIFSCLSGLRISDIRRIRWNDLVGREFVFTQHKGRKLGRIARIPLTNAEVAMLPPKRPGKDEVFITYADQYMNRQLKEICALPSVKIDKKISYHMSRHTFATLFLERGGKVEVLQQLLGHSEITTTMIYSHMTDKNKRIQKEDAFDGLMDDGET